MKFHLNPLASSPDERKKIEFYFLNISHKMQTLEMKWGRLISGAVVKSWNSLSSCLHVRITDEGCSLVKMIFNFLP